MSDSRTRFLTLLACATFCVACGKDPKTAPAGSGPATAATKQSDDPEGPTVADAEKQTADMIHGVSPGKPTAPVDLKFSLEAKPGVGAPLAIDLAVIATGPSDSLTLSVQGGDGLEVDASTSLATFPKSPLGALYRHQLKVTPRAEGAFFVDVVVTAAVPGGPQSRSFAIPILVGTAAALDKPDTPGSTG